MKWVGRRWLLELGLPWKEEGSPAVLKTTEQETLFPSPPHFHRCCPNMVESVCSVALVTNGVSNLRAGEKRYVGTRPYYTFYMACPAKQPKVTGQPPFRTKRLVSPAIWPPLFGTDAVHHDDYFDRYI